MSLLIRIASEALNSIQLHSDPCILTTDYAATISDRARSTSLPIRPSAVRSFLPLGLPAGFIKVPLRDLACPPCEAPMPALNYQLPTSNSQLTSPNSQPPTLGLFLVY